jgi:hypothetical protein
MIYYVDARSGDDNNDGLTKETAKKSISSLEDLVGKDDTISILPSIPDLGINGTFTTGYKKCDPPKDWSNLDSCYMFDFREQQWYKL